MNWLCRLNGNRLGSREIVNAAHSLLPGSRYEFVLEPFDEVIVRCRSIPSLFKIDLHKYVLKAARQWGVPLNVAAYWRMNCDKNRLHLPSHSHT